MTREVTRAEAEVLAVPVVTAFEMWGNKHDAALACLVMGLDIALADPILAARLSEAGQAILTNGGSLDKDTLKAVVALLTIILEVADAEAK